jgi:DNA-binding XRE family transcriptional regulator
MTKPEAQTEGQILKSMRVGAGLSQKALAEKIGISRETVVAIEREHPKTIKALKMQVLKNWSDACGAANNAAAFKNFKVFIKKTFSI